MAAAAAAAAAAVYPQPATRVTIPAAAAAAAATDDDLYEVRRDGPLQRAATFADINRPAAPASFTIPRYQVQAAVMLACCFDLEDGATVTVLRGANLLQDELRPADVSAVLHAAANAQHLETRLDSWRSVRKTKGLQRVDRQRIDRQNS